MRHLNLRKGDMEASHNLDDRQFRLLIESLYGFSEYGVIPEFEERDLLVKTIFDMETSFIDYCKERYDEAVEKKKAEEKRREERRLSRQERRKAKEKKKEEAKKFDVSKYFS